MKDRTLGHYRILETLGSGEMGVRPPGARRAPTAGRGPQGPGPRPAGRRNRPTALPPGGHGPFPDQPPVHRHHLRLRQRGRHRLPGDGADWGRHPGREAGRRAPASGRSGGSDSSSARAWPRPTRPASSIGTGSPATSRSRPTGAWKILDFGIATLRRLPEPDATSDTGPIVDSGPVYGTPPYVAPEQLLDDCADARCDLHALGAILYEAATGIRPFAGLSGPRLTAAILHEPPKPPRPA